MSLLRRLLIHASLDFVDEMINAKNNIEGKFEVILPELVRYQHIRDVDGDDETFTKIKNRLTIDNMKNVEICDALLILNYSHRNIENYIGGNSFVEMCIAFYLGKPIYLLNDIPKDMPYTEEIKALYPIVIHSIEKFVEIVT